MSGITTHLGMIPGPDISHGPQMSQTAQVSAGVTICCHGFVTRDQPRRGFVGAIATAYTTAVTNIIMSAHIWSALRHGVRFCGFNASMSVTAATIIFDHMVK